MRRFGRITLIFCAAGYVAACTAVVDSVVESRYGEYNRQTDYAKNEAILLNIVRASYYQPLNFMSFQPYTGAATASAMASSPAFVTGPGLTTAQKQLNFGAGAFNATASANGTISLTMLDTQNFYQAVLDPVDFTDLNTFQRQGYPREMLFRLFTNYVTLRPVDPRKQQQYAFVVYNDPRAENQCADLPREIVDQLYGPDARQEQRKICFSNLVEFALLSGLSSETRLASSPSASQPKGNANANANQGQNQKQGNQNSNTPQTTIEGRLCFDPALANRYQLEYYNHEMKNIRSGKAPNWLTPNYLRRFMNAIRSAQYHPVCGLTTGSDQWPQSAKSVSGGGVAPKPKQAPVEPPAPAAPPQAVAPPPEKAPPTPAKPPAVGGNNVAAPAPGSKPAPGVETLKVIVTTKTGSPVWDIHALVPDTVEIGTRSTFAIYNFLGRLLSAPESNEPGMNSNKLIGSEADDDDRYILTINRGQTAGCFVSVVYDLGVYCVPIDGAANTKRAFSILSQLLALKTTTGDLQLTPTLRLIP